MQTPEFTLRWGFFVLFFLIFGLSSFLGPLKYFLPSFCSCVSCCLATFLYLVGQGRAPDCLQTGCQHHPLATRPGARHALQRAAHIDRTLGPPAPHPECPLTHPLSHRAVGGTIDVTVHPSLRPYPKAMADI